ncbi:MAG TPA: hypothetical protein VI819_02840 [Patescibacteria group bacterium]|nr:hypothetical protein [Patescibacteria group bacterium]
MDFYKKKGFSTIGDVLGNLAKEEKGQGGLPLEFSRDKYVSREFQKYGYELAKELGDLNNRSLYIKLARDTPRTLLERAKSFVSDAYQVKSKPKLFMWRLKQLKEESKVNKLPHRNSK